MSGGGAAITGGCLCGGVRYEAREPLKAVHYCHCRMCQQAFASPFGMYGAVPAAALTFTKGAPRLYRSSAIAERGFCPDCGSQLSFRYLDADVIGLAIGSLDAPVAVVPQRHWGIESRLSWLRFDDGLEGKPTRNDPDFVKRRDAPD
ncbi:MAG: GFA family protein [Alphaproteobacteria bacterium]|jgi:hypothetical protein|nr:GFA family protein [Alphaproteobacteria bacterium]